MCKSNNTANYNEKVTENVETSISFVRCLTSRLTVNHAR